MVESIQTSAIMNAGMKVLEIPQTMAGMSPAMKDMERLMRIGQMTHERHPVARWCFGNVRVATDGNENIKPVKDGSFKDGDFATNNYKAASRPPRGSSPLTIEQIEA